MKTTVVPTPSRALALGNLHLIPMGIFLVAALAASMAEGEPWIIGLLLLAAINHVVFAVRIGHLGVDADEHALLVHQVYRTVAIPFPDVASVGVDDHPRIPGKRAIFIERANGKHVFLFGTTTGRWSFLSGRALMTDAEQADTLARLQHVVSVASRE